MKVQKHLFSIILITLLTLASTTHAQEIEDIYIEDLSPAQLEVFLEDLRDALPQSPEQGEGGVSCFDYYTFNSVEINVSPAVVSTVPGTTLTFFGTIENKNNYPIVHNTIYLCKNISASTIY